MKLAWITLGLALATAVEAAQPSTWAPRGPGGGGALFVPSFSPFNPNEMYLACDMSEVFHTTNDGAAWDVVDFRQIAGGRQALAQFTSDPNILYAIDLSNDAMTPTRSVDGGVTWEPLAADPTGGGAYSLYADPASTNRLVVSDYDNLYFSSDGGNSFATKATIAPNGAGCFVAGAFFDASNIFVGTEIGLLVSTNNGATFSLAKLSGINTNNEAMFSFAGAKEGGVTRFFCTTLHPADVFPGLLIEEIYTSYINTYKLDWGQTAWASATNGLSGGDDPVYVAMAQNDINTAYVGGQQNNDYGYPAIYKTANGGASWQLSALVTNNQNIFTGWEGAHGDSDWGYGGGALGLAVAPNNSSKAAWTDLGFAHVTTNGGAYWQQMYVNPADENPTNAATPRGRSYRSVGLENTSAWSLAWADNEHVVAGYTDIKGVISADGGNSWSFGYSGDTYNSMYSCVKNPASGVLYAGVSTVHDMYQSTHLTDASIGNEGGAVLFSTNLGVTWQTMTNFASPVIWVEMDPVNTNRLFASVIATNTSKAGIYVSTNIQKGASAVWKRLSAPTGTQGRPFNIHALNDGTLVCTYSGRRAGNPQEFTESSGVFVSSDDGSSWTNRSDPNMKYWTMDLVVSPNDAAQNTWYAGVYSGWGGPPNDLGGLYATTNRGVNWTRLNSDDGVNSCAFNPANSNELYVTTEDEGLLFCDNILAAAPTLTHVQNYPFDEPMRVFFNPYNPTEIWVTSFGNGMRVGNTVSLPGALQISPPQHGTAQINLQSGSPGATYSVLTSSNLVNWISLGTGATDNNGALRFQDTNATAPQRFYKSQSL